MKNLCQVSQLLQHICRILKMKAESQCSLCSAKLNPRGTAGDTIWGHFSLDYCCAGYGNTTRSSRQSRSAGLFFIMTTGFEYGIEENTYHDRQTPNHANIVRCSVSADACIDLLLPTRLAHKLLLHVLGHLVLPLLSLLILDRLLVRQLLVLVHVLLSPSRSLIED